VLNALTPAVLAELWKAFREDRAPDDPELAAVQKFMVLHGDMHPYWDRLLEDPAAPLVAEGEDLLRHVAIDTATERALERNEPPGLQALFSALVQKGIGEGEAFHVVAQAMEDEFVEEAQAGRTMGPAGFFRRAAEYCRQAMEQFDAQGG
jgi:hypothetical protein